MSSMRSDRLFRISAPYRRLQEISPKATPLRWGARRGEALVWQIALPIKPQLVELARCRPPGTSLLLVLPASQANVELANSLSVVSTTRPTHILPHLREVSPESCVSALRHPPLDLAADVTAYLSWRGLRFDSELQHIIRRIFDLCAETSTVTSLARALHISRRALGRRFYNVGMPVPSHWLQAARLLTSIVQLQHSSESIFTIAIDRGYPDGFSMSNQMMRLMKIRPSDARTHLGWEWIFERWLVQEAKNGGIGQPWLPTFMSGRTPSERITKSSGCTHERPGGICKTSQ